MLLASIFWQKLKLLLLLLLLLLSSSFYSSRNASPSSKMKIQHKSKTKAYKRIFRRVCTVHVSFPFCQFAISIWSVYFYSIFLMHLPSVAHLKIFNWISSFTLHWFALYRALDFESVFCTSKTKHQYQFERQMIFTISIEHHTCLWVPPPIYTATTISSVSIHIIGSIFYRISHKNFGLFYFFSSFVCKSNTRWLDTTTIDKSIFFQTYSRTFNCIFADWDLYAIINGTPRGFYLYANVSYLHRYQEHTQIIF